MQREAAVSLTAALRRAWQSFASSSSATLSEALWLGTRDPQTRRGKVGGCQDRVVSLPPCCRAAAAGSVVPAALSFPHPFHPAISLFMQIFKGSNGKVSSLFQAVSSQAGDMPGCARVWPLSGRLACTAPCRRAGLGTAGCCSKHAVPSSARPCMPVASQVT